MVRINIYMGGTLIAFLEGEPAEVWRRAVEYVRGMAHADGVTGGACDGWYRTANRPVYARGIFRATPGIADP